LIFDFVEIIYAWKHLLPAMSHDSYFKKVEESKELGEVELFLTFPLVFSMAELQEQIRAKF